MFVSPLPLSQKVVLRHFVHIPLLFNISLHRRNPTAVRHRYAQRCGSENEYMYILNERFIERFCFLLQKELALCVVIVPLSECTYFSRLSQSLSHIRHIRSSTPGAKDFSLLQRAKFTGGKILLGSDSCSIMCCPMRSKNCFCARHSRILRDNAKFKSKVV